MISNRCISAGKRLQRDIKRSVDARLRVSENLSDGRIKVSSWSSYLLSYRQSVYAHNPSFFQPKPIDVQVISHHMQRYAVWFGGSMLASTVSMSQYTHMHVNALKVWSNLLLFSNPHSPNSIKYVIRKPHTKNMDREYAVTIQYLAQCHRLDMCQCLALSTFQTSTSLNSINQTARFIFICTRICWAKR